MLLDGTTSRVHLQYIYFSKCEGVGVVKVVGGGGTPRAAKSANLIPVEWGVAFVGFQGDTNFNSSERCHYYY